MIMSKMLKGHWIRKEFVFVILVLLLVGILKADVTITTPSGGQVSYVTGITPVILDNGNYQFSLLDGGSLSVNYRRFTSEYLNLRSSSFGAPRLLFDRQGRLIEGDFITGKGGRYVLGNQRVDLLAGEEVHFKLDIDNQGKIGGGRADIDVAAGREVTFPESIDGKPGSSVFEYRSKDNKINLGDGNLFEITEGTGGIKYKDGKLFFDFDGRAKLNTLEILTENGDKTYIDFRGIPDENYDAAYISTSNKDGKVVIGSNAAQNDPKVNFLDIGESNPYGLKSLDRGDDNHHSVQVYGNSEGAFVEIVNRDKPGKKEGGPPKMRTLNGYATNFDDRSLDYNYNANKLQKPTKKGKLLVSGFSRGKSAVPIEIHSFRGTYDDMDYVSNTKTKDGRKPNIIGINDYNGWGLGTNPEYIITTTGYTGYSNLKTGFSNSWLYYNIATVEDFERYFRGRVDFTNYRGGGQVTPAGLIRLTDVLKNLPKEFWKEAGITRSNPLSVYNDRLSGGNTHYDGSITVQFNINDLPTIRHELGHAQHFARGGDYAKDVVSLWNSIRSSRGGFVSNYAMNWRGNENVAFEDIAETLSTVPNSKFVKLNYIAGNGFNEIILRGKYAALRKLNFITEDKFVGLGLDPKKVNEYIAEAQKLKKQNG